MDRDAWSSSEVLGRLGGLRECKRPETSWRPFCLDLERDLERVRCRFDFFILKVGNTLLTKSRWTVERPKNCKKSKKHGYITRLPVRVFVAQQERWSITCQRCDIRPQGVMVLRHVHLFSYPGGYSFFLLDALKSGS